MENEKVIVEFTLDEALVLFEWLTRNDERGSVVVEHPAEQHVLWVIEGQLERNLQAPLSAQYRSLLNDARKRVSEKSVSDPGSATKTPSGHS